jgi:hypothetical protein
MSEISSIDRPHWKWNGKAYVRFSRSQSCTTESGSTEDEKKINDPKILNHETIEFSLEGKSRIMSCEKFFDDSMNNRQIYLEIIEPMLYSCLQGVHGTIFTCLPPKCSISPSNLRLFLYSRWYLFVNKKYNDQCLF